MRLKEYVDSKQVSIAEAARQANVDYQRFWYLYHGTTRFVNSGDVAKIATWSSNEVEFPDPGKRKGTPRKHARRTHPRYFKQTRNSSDPICETSGIGCTCEAKP